MNKLNSENIEELKPILTRKVNELILDINDDNICDSELESLCNFFIIREELRKESREENSLVVGINNKWRGINKSGDIVIEPQFEFINNFKNELARVFIGNMISIYIDRYGNKVWSPKKINQEIKKLNGMRKSKKA